LTNSIIGDLRVVLFVITLGIFGCDAHINKNISFGYDPVQRLPVVLGLYFPTRISLCENKRISIGPGYGRKSQFHIDEMTAKFWPKVFKTGFEKVHVLRDISADISSKDLDLIAEVGCISFSSHAEWRDYFGKVRPFWKATVSFLVTLSCPKGGHLKAYVVEEKDSVGAYDSAPLPMLSPHSVLISKLFQKTGRVFIERALPEVKALATKCGGVTIPHEPSKIISEHEIFSPLIGQTRESVIDIFGLPNQEIETGEEYFMIYSSTPSGTRLLLVSENALYEDANNQSALHCLRFELDSNKLVKSYEVKSGGTWVDGGRYAINSQCRGLFYWGGKELGSLHVVLKSELEWSEAQIAQKAEQGSAYAQLQLYKTGITNDITLEMLCKSADQGNMEARYILGDLFLYGGRYFPTKNSIYAYVWYSLSVYTSKEDYDYVVELLTDDELVKAKKLLLDWHPGQCEKDLGLVSYTE